MTGVRVSVCIPYKARLENLAIALQALAGQTMDHADFEVVIGAMEYDPKLTEVCAQYATKLNIVMVCSSKEFHIPHARNLAMRSATGEVIVQMDADTLLDAHALQILYERHFAFGQQLCAVGQVVGYDSIWDATVESVELRPFSEYAHTLAELAAAPDWPADPRFRVPHNIPWAFAWTGLIAVSALAVRAHQLYFDESFRGWGVEDLEWGFRVSLAGLPVVRCPEVFALNLPHARDADANQRTESGNFRRFLAKWPRRDVELCQVMGDTQANDHWPSYLADLARVAVGGALGVAYGTCEGRPVARLGVPLGRDERPLDESHVDGLDPASVQIWALTGMSLPVADRHFAKIWVSRAIAALPLRHRDAVLAEARRAASHVIVETATV